MIHSTGNVIWHRHKCWIGVILLCLEITWLQGKPAGNDDSDVTLAKRLDGAYKSLEVFKQFLDSWKQHRQQQASHKQFNFKVGNKTFVLVYTVPGVSGDQARDWCQKLRSVVDIDAKGWPIYLRGDLPSSNETLTKMGKTSINQIKHTEDVLRLFGKDGKRLSELDEFRYTLLYIDHEKIKGNTSRDKLLASPLQEAKPENEAGNEAGKCVYSKHISTYTERAYERIETGACESQNTMFVCQMEKES